VKKATGKTQQAVHIETTIITSLLALFSKSGHNLWNTKLYVADTIRDPAAQLGLP
jgi:hypothetical protein